MCVLKQIVGLENKAGDGRVIKVMWSVFHWEGIKKTFSESKPIPKIWNNLHAGSTLCSFCSQGIEPRLLERL